MPNIRSLIIAIQDYPKASSLAAELAGTNAAASDFVDWLRNTKAVTPSDIWLCSSTDFQVTGANKFGTSKAEIKKALISLANTGRNTTRQLYVFMSGHGFAFSTVKDTSPADMFVSSGYENEQVSGDECLGISELQEMLAYWLGGEDHFYFLDSCRNVIAQDDIAPTRLGLKLNGADVGKPFVYTLYSTTTGTQAFTTSGFSTHLMNALRGAGRAKGWTSDNRNMQVVFDSVYRYVRSKIGTQQADAKPGGGEGVIFILPNIPQYDCSIEIRNAEAKDTFTAQLLLRGNPIGQIFRIQGKAGKISASPDAYNIQLIHPTAKVVQIDPPGNAPVDLFDNSSAKFELSGLPSKPVPLGAPSHLARINVTAPLGTTIELTNLHSRLTPQRSAVGSVNETFEPGAYSLRILENSVPISEKIFEVESGGEFQTDINHVVSSKLRQNILKALGQSPHQGVVDFSEQIGPTANGDMGLWLSLLGASKIVQNPRNFEKLSLIPAADFSDMPPNSAAIYVLAGFDSDVLPLSIAIPSGSEMLWKQAELLNAVEGIQNLRIDVDKPGSILLSIAIGNNPIQTFPIHCIPNRVTLIVLTEDATQSGQVLSQDRIRRFQFVLPVGHLLGFMDPYIVDAMLDGTSLRTVKAMFSIQSTFCAKRRVAFPNTSEISGLWQSSMDGKWFDPIMSVIMCYEMLRRGEKDKRHDQLRIVANNLKRYFSIPDADAILSRLGDTGKPDSTPLFTDGVLPFTEETNLFPFTVTKLDYGNPWTTWENVVQGPSSEVASPPTGNSGGLVHKAKLQAEMVKDEEAESGHTVSASH